MPPLLPLGIALFLAYPVGRFFARFGVPRVTGYLVTGILLGPSLMARNPEALPVFLEPFALGGETVKSLKGVKDLAQAMILFAIGMGLRADKLRTAGRRSLVLSLSEIGLTFGLVALLVFLATGAADARLAIVLGAVAVATAPAATMLVIRELDSQGPTTQRIVTLVGIDNIASLLLFALAFGSLYLGSPAGSLASLGIGALEGLLIGLALAVLLLRIASERAFAVLTLGAVIGAWGLALWTNANPLLSCLVVGATMANGSPWADGVRDRLRQLDYPIYVAFFVLAGAELHLDLLLGIHPLPGLAGGAALLLTAAYIVGRAGGKFLSAPFTRWATRGRERVRTTTGLALMAQAGLAIALADAAVREGVPQAKLIQGIILSSVAFFELVGPLCVRYSVVHAGEVKLVNLLPERVREGFGQSIVDTLSRLRRTLGLPAMEGPHDAARIRAMDVMRRNFEPIRADMHFEELVRTFAEAPYDQYPVVDGDGVYLGVISFPEIRSILFDDMLEEVVVAADLITGPGVTCGPETTLPEVIRIFEECQGEYSHLPVVEGGTPSRVLGIVEQRAAVVAYRRHR